MRDIQNLYRFAPLKVSRNFLQKYRQIVIFILWFCVKIVGTPGCVPFKRFRRRPYTACLVLQARGRPAIARLRSVSGAVSGRFINVVRRLWNVCDTKLIRSEVSESLANPMGRAVGENFPVPGIAGEALCRAGGEKGTDRIASCKLGFTNRVDRLQERISTGRD